MVCPGLASAAGTAGAAGLVGFTAAAFCTSCSVILPAGPVPVTVAKSTPRSAAIFLALGEAMILPAGLAGSGSALAGSAAGGASAAGAASAGAGVAPVSESAKLCGTSSSLAPRTKTGAPTGRVSSAFTRMCLTKPSAGDSISSVALSVSISKITSPFLTSSPTLTRQLTTVPSSIVCPSCGNLTSFAIYEILNLFRYLLYCFWCVAATAVRHPLGEAAAWGLPSPSR